MDNSRLQVPKQQLAPLATPAGRRPQICPSWMSKEEFEVCRSDPYQAFNAAQAKIAELHQRVTIAKKLNQALLEDPQYKHGQAVQSFERLKQEHIQLNDAYNDLEAVNETLQEVTDVLRGDKHGLLVEINALKREITIQTIENQQIDLKTRQLKAFNDSIDLKLHSQEAQLAQLDDDCKEAGRQAVVLDNEITALDSTCQNYSLQSGSLSDLRQHLDTTRVAQDRAIQALEREVQSKAQEIIQHDAQLWEFKREMSGRILALQKKAQECNDELSRLHRLSEHEINTLAAQNRALNDELKSTADALFATRREKTDFSTAAKKEIYQRKEEVQQCLSVLDLVERQNQGLEAAIHRLMEQNKLGERQVMEKDNINNKNLIEQANFISMLHMELQATREDLYILKARLCRHCRETLLGDEIEEEALLPPGRRQGAIAGPAGSDGVKPMEFDERGGVKAPDGLTDTERAKMENELKRTREALEALNRQLLDERQQRNEERMAEEAQRREDEDDRNARHMEETAKHTRAKEDERKVAAGEEALTFTIRFVDGTRRKIDAFPTDKVGDMVSKVCAKLGIRAHEHFFIAHRVNENSVLGGVDAFLHKDRTLAEQQITPKANLIFKVKHYKRHKKWTDNVAQEWFFRQIHHSVISEYYPTSEKLAVELASLEIQSVFGDYSGKKRHAYFDRVGLDSYLPVSVSAHEYEYWQERLFRWHKRRKGLTAIQARGEYIDAFATKSPYWGLTFFDISDRTNQKFLAGIGEDGMYIFTPDKRSLIASWPFDDLVSWNRNQKGFFAKKRNQSSLTIFGTSELQSLQMVALLNEYYMMLPQDYRDRLSIAIDGQEEIRTADLYLDPIAHRRKPVEYQSRLEVFKEEYMDRYLHEHSSEMPVRKLCELIDQALDENRNLEDLDLSQCDPPLTDTQLASILDALDQARRYSKSGEQLVDNFQPTSLNLWQPTGTLTDSSITNICNFLNVFPGITYVNLSNVQLGSQSDSDICTYLSRLPNLKTLVLKKCDIKPRLFTTLIDQVFSIEPPLLEVLDVEDNELDHPCVATLCKYIAGETNRLRELNIAYNRVEAQGLDTLIATVAQKNASRGARLEVLKCGGNKFGPAGAGLLSRLVTTGLKELSIAATEMSAENALSISATLRNNGGSITTLDMSRNINIGNILVRQRQAGDTRDNAQQFFSFLAGGSHSNVSSLDLSGNDIQADAGSALAKVLEHNAKLVDINLASNRMAQTINGLLPESWADLMMRQRFITRLDLSNNGIKYMGLRRLLTAIASNKDTNLKVLRLDGNKFDDAPHGTSHAEIKDFFMQNLSIHELYLNAMGIRDDLLVKIGEGLGANRAIRVLQASSNAFTTRGVADFSHFLASNTSLQNLDLSGRDVQISDDTYLQAYKMLIDNSNVETILL